MYIYILVKLALALVVVLNINNAATEKVSSITIHYKSKFDVANFYACIRIILIIFVLGSFLKIAIFE